MMQNGRISPLPHVYKGARGRPAGPHKRAKGGGRRRRGDLIHPFCIMLLYWYLLHYGLLLHIMSQYLCLFSLSLQGLHEEGECWQLEFWAGKGANIRDYSAQLQKSWNSTKDVFGNNKKYWAEETPEGAHTLATRVGVRPTPLGATTCLVAPL